MQKHILFLITLLSAVLLNAQNTQSVQDWQIKLHEGHPNEYFFTQADLVFEGSFIKIVATYNPEGGNKSCDNYAISAYKVYNLYKGDRALTRGDTVYLVSKGVILGYENVDISRYDISPMIPRIFQENDIPCSVHRYTPSVFFFSVSDLPDYGPSVEYPSDKKYKFLLNVESRLFTCENYTAGLNNLIFDNREDFYTYMRQFEGYTVPIARVK